MRRVRRGSVAVLRSLPGRARDDRGSLVPAVRCADARDRTELPGLPTPLRRARASAVRFRWARAPRRPSAEVLGVAPDRRGPRRRDGGRLVGGTLLTRCRRLGAVVPCATRGPRLRPGQGSRPRGRPSARHPRRALAGPGRRSGAAGQAGRRRSSGGDARHVRAGPPPTGPDPARGRRAHDRRDRRRLRRGAPRGRGGRGRPAHGRSCRLVGSGGGGEGSETYTREWARVRVCGCPGERFPGSRCQPRAKRPT
jgi:hypothetical protein